MRLFLCQKTAGPSHTIEIYFQTNSHICFVECDVHRTDGGYRPKAGVQKVERPRPENRYKISTLTIFSELLREPSSSELWKSFRPYSESKSRDCRKGGIAVIRALISQVEKNLNLLQILQTMRLNQINLSVSGVSATRKRQITFGRTAKSVSGSW